MNSLRALEQCFHYGARGTVQIALLHSSTASFNLDEAIIAYGLIANYRASGQHAVKLWQGEGVPCAVGLEACGELLDSCSIGFVQIKRMA